MRPSPGALVSRVLHGWCTGISALCALVGLTVLLGGSILGVEALTAFAAADGR